MDTIIFDVDDTLYDNALSFHKTFRELFEGTFAYEDIDQIYRASRVYNEMLFEKNEAGEITPFEWHTGRIISACNDFDIPIDMYKAATFHEVYVSNQQNIELFNEVEKLLDALYKENKQLAILTNGEENHQSMKIKQLNLTKWIPSDNIFISETCGHPKPKIEVFRLLEKKLDLNPPNTVYIGDSFEKDVLGAKQAGWQAIWMNHRRRKIPDNPPFKPDIEVQSARELLNLFVR